MDYLIHYGVKGMKWGVRKSPERSGNSHPMSKREAKKAIKNAKRAYRKETGKWMTTGKNVAAIDKQRQNELWNDDKLKKISADRKEAGKEMNRAESKLNKARSEANLSKDHLQRLQKDSSASRSMRRDAESRYISQKKKADSLNAKWNDYYNKYNALDTAYDKRQSAINKKYINRYKNAVVKDLNISDVNAGMKMLEDYGLYKRALRPSLSGRK